MGASPRPVTWVGSSLDDLKAMPDEVQDDIGYALYIAQCGEKHASAKQMAGTPGVFEIVSDFDTDTYRAVYVARFADAICVLHAFQKKSKRGRAIPRRDRELIEKRFKDVLAMQRARRKAG